MYQQKATRLVQVLEPVLEKCSIIKYPKRRITVVSSLGHLYELFAILNVAVLLSKIHLQSTCVELKR